MYLITGVGDKDLRVYEGSLRIRIGPYEVNIPTFYSSQERTPFLLGRTGVFDFFNITFDNREKSIRFDLI